MKDFFDIKMWKKRKKHNFTTTNRTNVKMLNFRCTHKKSRRMLGKLTNY